MSAEQEKMIEEQQREERRNIYISLAGTLGFVVLLLFISMFWFAFPGNYPPIEEQEWTTIGSFAADFGTDNKGSGDVNNFRKPSDTPADRPVTQPENTNPETPKPAQVSSPTSPSMESNTKTEVTVVKAQPTKSETATSGKPTDKPDVKKPELESFDTPTNNASPNNNSGGSNDGNSNTTGNNGNPRATVLGEGQFQFGNGIGGAGGREPLSIKMPNYNVQNEAKITFQFVIAPSGEVILVKPEMTTHTDLARIGADAIKKWRFSEVEPSRGNLKTTVTITFRLQ